LKIIKSLVICSPAASKTKLHRNTSGYPFPLFLSCNLTISNPEELLNKTPVQFPKKNSFVYFLKQAPSTVITSTVIQEHVSSNNQGISLP